MRLKIGTQWAFVRERKEGAFQTKETATEASRKPGNVLGTWQGELENRVPMKGSLGGPAHTVPPRLGEEFRFCGVRDGLVKVSGNDGQSDPRKMLWS